MSTRQAVPAEGFSGQTTPAPRLSAVLAAGLAHRHAEVANVDARVLGLQKKLAKGSKAKPRINLDALKEKVISMDEEARVLADVFSYTDSRDVSNGSLENEYLVTSITAVRLFEHIGLVKMGSMDDFYEAADIFLVVSDLQAELAASKPAAIGNLFNDANKGQVRRQVFNDATLGTILSDYLANLVDFTDHVAGQQWSSAGDKVMTFGPLLGEAILHVLLPLAGKFSNLPAFTIISELNSWYNSRTAQVVTMFGNTRSELVEASLGLQTGSRLLAEMRVDLVRNLWKMLPGNWFKRASLTSFRSVATDGLRWWWEVSTSMDPMTKFFLMLAMAVFRALYRCILMKPATLKSFVALNTKEEATRWTTELRLASFGVGGTQEDLVNAKNKLADIKKAWHNAWDKLDKAVNSKGELNANEQRALANLAPNAMFNDAATQVTQFIKAFAIQTRHAARRNTIKKYIDIIDNSIKELQNIEDKYPKDIIDGARRSVANGSADGAIAQADAAIAAAVAAAEAAAAAAAAGGAAGGGGDGDGDGADGADGADGI